MDLRGAVIIVDEAHNLLEAINSAYSAALSAEALASARRADQTGRGGRLPLTRRRRNVLRVVLAGGERKIVVVSSAVAPQPDF